MPRTKSGRKAAQKFKATLQRIDQFTQEILAASDLSDQAVTWTYEAALIKTYVAFERLMLDCIVTAINNDTSTISTQTNIKFPKHLTDEVCEYLVTRGRYFDFKGRDGLIKVIKTYVPDGHWLLKAVRHDRHKEQLNILVALRNYAAHESPTSKREATKAVEQRRLRSAGAWIKCQRRFPKMTNALINLADEIQNQAPH